MTLDLRRRRFVLGSAAFLSQAGLSRVSLAQPSRLDRAPVVDSLAVRVITDSSYDTPVAGTSKWVKVRRVNFISAKDFRKTLHNEWGLSLALESRAGSDTRHILLDSGYTPAALMNNLEIMGVDGSKVQALIVSHGHYDHFGGLVGFLEKYRGQLPGDLTLYVGGEDVFCTRKRPPNAEGHLTDAGVLDRRELDRLKVKVVTCQQPTVILGHAFTTGTIQKRSFERVSAGPLVEYFPSNGAGCNIPAENEKAQGKAVKDEHIHEHATCFHVKDRGLVVMTSCGHTGIVNATRTAMEVSGVKKVHAVMGGFHLFPASEDYLRKTIDELKVLDPDVIIPMHCSGPSLLTLLRSEMADRVVTSTTGTEFVFGG